MHNKEGKRVLNPMEDLQQRVLGQLDLSREVEDSELIDLIHRVLESYGEEQYLSLQERVDMGKDLFNAFRKLDVIQELLEQEDITEIMINGTNGIFIEQEGKIHKLDKRFVSRKKLEDVVQQIAGNANRIVNESSPIVDARLEDGSRVNIVLPPIALNGPIVTIRKFPTQGITMDRLLAWGSIGQEEVIFLKKLVQARYNIFISGGTGSGKTTFLNALSQFIPSDERVVTIEDNAELQLRGIPNLVRLEARGANVEGTGEITIRQLIKTALRMRPDRIIVGEVRAEEAIDMLQAMNTGHDGSLSTGHANSPADMLSRLETMVLTGMDLPLPAIDRQIASGVDIIIHLGRLRDKTRKLLEIQEVIGYRDGRIQVRPLVCFREKGVKNGKIQGIWEKVESLLRQEKLLAAGITPA